MLFGSNNISKHQRSHNQMQINLPNGKFSKAILISKFEEKGQIFPQNEKISEKNATKMKKEKMKSNEISKKP